jgi:cation diffusion facilitator CzcD-associated flavoprotein CzcO
VVPTRVKVVIVGAGFGGIGLGIRLKNAGLHEFVILEKSDSIGGVWRENQYPGAACDVPSHLYSFSFEPRADWRTTYADQAEILDYLAHCVRKHDLGPHIRCGAEVKQARWDAAARHWVVSLYNDVVFNSQSVVMATGQLGRALLPRLPGLEKFSGAVFHSAQWRADHDLRGKRVAVIGTGASAIQFVPRIAALADQLHVFQRSAAYVLPKPDRTYPRWQKFMFMHVPGALRLSRLFIYLRHELIAFAFVSYPAALRVKRRAFFRHLRRGVRNPELRRRLTPNYRIGCKRILLSNDFYPAMDRPNVELVTGGIREIRSCSIVAADGTERQVDCIIFGTGFAASDFLVPMTIIGRDGKDLREAWKNGAEAHLGMTIAGFPNFFMLYGPNTNLAHNSIVYMIECQIRYVLACLKRLCGKEIQTLEIKAEIQDRFNIGLEQRLRKTVWSKGCTSWYLTATGKNTANWPGYSLDYMRRTRAPRWDDYAVS